MKVGALVVAAGRGSRFGGDIPKQYSTLNGRPVLRHSLAVFAAHPAISFVRTVIRPEDRELYEQAAQGLNLPAPIPGGTERQDSVRLGLESLADLGLDAVLIHDGARPFITRALIDRTLAALETSAGAIPALAVSDTLKRAVEGRIIETVPRDGLWRAQTPQAFRFSDILAAHRHAVGKTLTDDAAVLEHFGETVAIVPGDAQNIKITTAADIDLHSGTPLSWEPRVGTGFDVHALCEGSDVTICGVRISHTQALLGHSDADVALHALNDALYGAIGAADIGHHFPPSNPQWKGCASRVFLEHAVALIDAMGGKIANVDVTIICEAPRIGPHRGAMIASLSEILRLSPDRISVKATTTEQLGFTGRREGIAAQAVATVLVPQPL